MSWIPREQCKYGVCEFVMFFCLCLRCLLCHRPPIHIRYLALRIMSRMNVMLAGLMRVTLSIKAGEDTISYTIIHANKLFSAIRGKILNLRHWKERLLSPVFMPLKRFMTHCSYWVKITVVKQKEKINYRICWLVFCDSVQNNFFKAHISVKKSLIKF